MINSSLRVQWWEHASLWVRASSFRLFIVTATSFWGNYFWDSLLVRAFNSRLFYHRFSKSWVWDRLKLLRCTSWSLLSKFITRLLSFESFFWEVIPFLLNNLWLLFIVIFLDSCLLKDHFFHLKIEILGNSEQDKVFEILLGLEACKKRWEWLSVSELVYHYVLISGLCYKSSLSNNVSSSKALVDGFLANLALSFIWKLTNNKDWKLLL